MCLHQMPFHTTTQNFNYVKLYSSRCNLTNLPSLDCHMFDEAFPHDLLTYWVLSASGANNMTRNGNMTALDIGLVDYIIEKIYVTYCSKTKGDNKLLHNSVTLIHPTLKPWSSSKLVVTKRSSIRDTKVEASITNKIREFAFILKE